MLSISVCGLAGGAWDQMQTSMLRQDKGEKAANLAFCFAIFPSCSRAVGALPAGGEAVESQAPAAPLGPANHYTTFTQDQDGAKGKQKTSLGLTALFLSPALPKSRSM